MATTTYRRGDFVKYIGSVSRFHSTWWTISAVNYTRGGRVANYTLENRGIGRLRHVSPSSVNQDREAVA